jgi:cell division protein FtsN
MTMSHAPVCDACQLSYTSVGPSGEGEAQAQAAFAHCSVPDPAVPAPESAERAETARLHLSVKVIDESVSTAMYGLQCYGVCHLSFFT